MLSKVLKKRIIFKHHIYHPLTLYYSTYFSQFSLEFQGNSTVSQVLNVLPILFNTHDHLKRDLQSYIPKLHI